MKIELGRRTSLLIVLGYMLYCEANHLSLTALTPILPVAILFYLKEPTQ